MNQREARVQQVLSAVARATETGDTASAVSALGRLTDRQVRDVVSWLGAEDYLPRGRVTIGEVANALCHAMVARRGSNPRRASRRRGNFVPLASAAITGIVGGTAWEGVKAAARSSGGGQRKDNAGAASRFSVPFGPAEVAAYSRVAGALARGGRGAVRPAAVLRRAGLLRDWELRRYSPGELAQIATERLSARRGNPFVAALVEGFAAGVGVGVSAPLVRRLAGDGSPRRQNHPGAFVFAIGNPRNRAARATRVAARSPRRKNYAGGYQIKLPADRVLGTMSLAEARRRWPDVDVQVAAFQDMNRGAKPSDTVILWDDGRKDVQCGYVFGKNHEMVYGGVNGSPPGSFKDTGGVEGGRSEGTTWVHKAHHQYWVGHAELDARGRPVTRDFNSIGDTRASDGWLRERGE